MNIPINYFIFLGPLLLLYKTDIRKHFRSADDLIIVFLILTIAVSVFGALIDFFVVFRDDLHGDYQWTYEPNLFRWGVGLLLIYITFFVPVYYLMGRSFRPALVVGNNAVIWNVFAWSLVPHLVNSYSDYGSFLVLLAFLLLPLLLLLAIVVSNGIHTWWREEDIKGSRSRRTLGPTRRKEN
jgi:hypothetical protein